MVTPKMLRQFAGLTEEAIQRAIEQAKERIRGVAMAQTPVGDPTNYGYTSTGRSPGQLRESFEIANTPRSIVFKWEAYNEGVDYAPIVEEGRTGWHPFGPRYYAAATTQEAKRILVEELYKEFSALSQIAS